MSPILHSLFPFLILHSKLNSFKCFTLIKDAETPVIELLELEPSENSMTITTTAETLLVHEEQGQ